MNIFLNPFCLIPTKNRLINRRLFRICYFGLTMCFTPFFFHIFVVKISWNTKTITIVCENLMILWRNTPYLSIFGYYQHHFGNHNYYNLTTTSPSPPGRLIVWCHLITTWICGEKKPTINQTQLFPLRQKKKLNAEQIGEARCWLSCATWRRISMCRNAYCFFS